MEPPTDAHSASLPSLANNSQSVSVQTLDANDLLSKSSTLSELPSVTKRARAPPLESLSKYPGYEMATFTPRK